MRKILCCIICVFLTAALAAGWAEAPADIPVRLVKASTAQEQIVLVGSTYSIEYLIMPEDATDKSLEWTSSDPAVAAVDETGTVTAVGAGDAVITAATKDGSNRKFQVRIHVPTLRCDTESVSVTEPGGTPIKLNYYGNDLENDLIVSVTGKCFEYEITGSGNEAEVMIRPFTVGEGTISFRDRKDRKSTASVNVSVAREALTLHQYIWINDVSVDRKRMKISYTNNYGEFIREVGFRMIPYDENGEQLYLSKNVGGESRAYWDYEIKDGETKKESWYVDDYYWVDQVDVAVYYIQLKDGTEIRLADNDLYWFSSKENSYKGKPERVPVNAYPISHEIVRSDSYQCGFNHYTVTADLADHYGFSHSGLYITSVVEGSIAYRAGLKPTDMIVAVDGVSLADDPYALTKAKARIVDEGSFTVTVERFGEKELIEMVFERIAK